MVTNNKYLVGVYGDDEMALKAVKSIKAANVKIHEVYFPLNDVEKDFLQHFKDPHNVGTMENPDGFAEGVYVYTITFTDEFGNSIADSVTFFNSF